MNQRKAGRLLWKVAIAASGGAVVSIALAVALPLDLPPPSDDAAASPATFPSSVMNSQADDIPSLSQWARVWSIDLGHDVVASHPSPAAPAVVPQTAPPELHLIGTIIEPDHSVAMFVGADGKTHLLLAGDQIQGATITSIGIDSVTVDMNGKPAICKVEKPPPASGKPAATIAPEDQ